jgi:hypothetical protein
MFRRDVPTSSPTTRRFGRETAGLLLLFFVAMDALATLLMLRLQHGHEINPVMDWLWGRGEAWFLLIKMLLTALVVLWLLRRADGWQLRVALTIGFAIYVPIVGLHIYNNIWVEHALMH